MGKRKLPSDHSQTHPPPFSPHPSDLADIMPCSSGMELLSQEKPLHSVDSGEQLKSLSSVLDSTDSSLKLLNAHPSVAQQHHPSLGRSTFFKRSRHHYAHQYSRRNSGNLANTSTSRGKGVPLRDDKLSYKLATQSNSESRRHSEIRENPFLRQPRIRSSYLTTDAASPDPGKMVAAMLIMQIVWSRKQVLKIDATRIVRCVLDCCPRLKIQESRSREGGDWIGSL
ncbi:PREDICTED: uncharacterized protein LOC103341139 isoform X3 [Prunus mume]|uniref:Uncharacterized protein LOC103341139 isoform X3 n=1 Tax=Prunus mume TaxID=102107 RepID=A0ABM1LW10_PRUMU|nr:PREDICTED: uncharacterized protein LOC103341139 isoform X3 [Prunus mume]